MFCTRNPVSLEHAAAIPVPAATRSYKPVANEDLVGHIRHTFTALTRMRVDSEHYGLTGKDQRFFGVMRFVAPGQNEGLHSLSIGFRNSYDKSIAVGLAVGASVFVCDNMCFSGDSFVVLRKHTTNVWQDLHQMIHQAAMDARQTYNAVTRELEHLQNRELTDDMAYALFGLALGREVLSPTQVNAALRDWKEPRHPEFQEKTLWSWYNCCNEALKTTPADQMLTRHTALHELALRQPAR